MKPWITPLLHTVGSTTTPIIFEKEPHCFGFFLQISLAQRPDLLGGLGAKLNKAIAALMPQPNTSGPSAKPAHRCQAHPFCCTHGQK